MDELTKSSASEFGSKKEIQCKEYDKHLAITIRFIIYVLLYVQSLITPHLPILNCRNRGESLSYTGNESIHSAFIQGAERLMQLVKNEGSNSCRMKI